MDTINFKDWLEEKGVLLEYVRYRVADPEWSTCMAPVEGIPNSWITSSFWFSKMGIDVNVKWSRLSDEWVEACGGCRPVVPGMPMNDKLGMILLLAELEAKDE